MRTLIGTIVLMSVLLPGVVGAQPAEPDWSTYALSASVPLGATGDVGRAQLYLQGPGIERSFPEPGALPANARINGFDRLRNGNYLITFSNVVQYPGAFALFPGDIIEVTPSFDFVGLVFDALAAPGWDRTININALALDETVTGMQLYFSIDRSANIDGIDFRPSQVIVFNGTTYSLAFGGPGTPLTLGGFNINAIDRVLVNGTRHLFLSFESPGHLHGHDFYSDDVLGYQSGSGFYIVDRPRLRHPGMARQKLEALDVFWGAAPDGDGVFNDRFEAGD